MRPADPGRPILRQQLDGLTLGDVRQWVADMEAAGADDSAPAFGAVIAPRPGYPSALAGLSGLTGLGGLPRVSTGPVPPPPGKSSIPARGARHAPRQDPG